MITSSRLEGRKTLTNRGSILVSIEFDLALLSYLYVASLIVWIVRNGALVKFSSLRVMKRGGPGFTANKKSLGGFGSAPFVGQRLLNNSSYLS